ncbi:hypothetical protein ACO0QE_003961 [Hanseniaspora vineae]
MCSKWDRSNTMLCSLIEGYVDEDRFGVMLLASHELIAQISSLVTFAETVEHLGKFTNRNLSNYDTPHFTNLCKYASEIIEQYPKIGPAAVCLALESDDSIKKLCLNLIEKTDEVFLNI